MEGAVVVVYAVLCALLWSLAECADHCLIERVLARFLLTFERSDWSGLQQSTASDLGKSTHSHSSVAIRSRGGR